MTNKFIIFAFSFGLIGATATADVAATIIDRQLTDQVDFRDPAFAGCFGQTTCDVDLSLPGSTSGEILQVTFSISAERDGGILSGWLPAEIYWDPVDGFGVMGGGQNDEIDFNEQLTVSLSTPLSVSGMWFSDMFIGEQAKNGVNFDAQPDVEAADVDGTLSGQTVMQHRISGEAILPADSFNISVNDGFIDGGDALNLVLINEGDVSILLRDQEGQGPSRIIRTTIGEIDTTKLDIFAGVEVIQIDATTLFGETEFVPLLTAGLRNAVFMEQMVANQPQLASVRTEAGRQRLVSDIPNGEVGFAISAAVTLDKLVFSAELMTSNDYSVVGFMVEN